MTEKEKKNRFVFFDKEIIEEKDDMKEHTPTTLVDLAIKQAILMENKIFILDKQKNEIFIFESN